MITGYMIWMRYDIYTNFNKLKKYLKKLNIKKIVRSCSLPSFVQIFARRSTETERKTLSRGGGGFLDFKRNLEKICIVFRVGGPVYIG